jgi:hypothetical protein
MGVFRSDRWSAARNLLVGVLVYLVAATGMLGAVARAAHGQDASGTGIVICTVEGMATVHDGSQPAKPAHPPQHCALCNVTGDVAAPTPSAVGKSVEPPVASRAPGRTYDPILPAYAFDGWLGTRSPRAPPVSA